MRACACCAFASCVPVRPHHTTTNTTNHPSPTTRPPSTKHRSLAVDTIHAQATGITGVKCVYACLSGQADEIIAALDARPGARGQTVVVAAPEGASPAIKLATAAAAAAAAEGFRNAGADALLVLDDVDTLSEFWDLTSRTLLR